MEKKQRKKRRSGLKYKKGTFRPKRMRLDKKLISSAATKWAMRRIERRLVTNEIERGLVGEPTLISLMAVLFITDTRVWLSVGEIVETLERTYPQISRKIKVLSDANLLDLKKKKNTHYYSWSRRGWAWWKSLVGDMPEN